MGIAEPSWCNFARRATAIIQMRGGQVPWRVGIVSYHDVFVDNGDCESPSLCGFGDFITTSSQVKRPRQWWGAGENPTPVSGDAEGNEGL